MLCYSEVNVENIALCLYYHTWAQLVIKLCLDLAGSNLQVRPRSGIERTRPDPTILGISLKLINQQNKNLTAISNCLGCV